MAAKDHRDLRLAISRLEYEMTWMLAHPFPPHRWANAVASLAAARREALREQAALAHEAD